MTDKTFRQASEVEAYKAQIKVDASAHGCAISSIKEYGLNLTIEQASKELAL